MIDTLANIINDAIVLNVQKKHGWAQLIGGNPHAYAGSGQWRPIAQDTEGGWSYIRLNGQVSVTSADIGQPCSGVGVNIPVRYVAMMNREECGELPGLLVGIAGVIRGTSKQVRTAIRAASVDFGSIRFGIDEVGGQEFKPAIKDLTARTLVNIDIVVTITGSEDCLKHCRNV